jgi:capsular polysaccharide biosynthesis protein
MKQASNKPTFDSLSVFEFLWKWKAPIGWVCFAAIITSSIFSAPWFVKPKYKSSVIFYPSTTNSISKAVLNDDLKEDPLQFGEEEQSDQLIQILQSDVIREQICSTFKLMEHYEIPSDAKDAIVRLQRQYDENIKFKRTEYMSVVIEVLDTDPSLAAKIANEIARLLDVTKNKIQKEKAVKTLLIVEQTYNKKKKEVAALSDSVTAYRKLGLYEYTLQAEYITKEMVQLNSMASQEEARLGVLKESNVAPNDTMYINARARFAGAKSALIKLQKEEDIIKKYGSAFMSALVALDVNQRELARLSLLYEKAKVDAEEELPVKFVVNSAKVSHKKAWPVRWLIVLLSTLGAFLLSIIVIVSVENYRLLKWKPVNDHI